MKKCDHIVGLYRSQWDDGSDILVNVSDLGKYGTSLWPDEAFKFCPECGKQLPHLQEQKSLDVVDVKALFLDMVKNFKSDA